ncbi:TetR/AcrR family transcriptional regulator C-terminal ligand-binding domain-containing protein [Streptomyces celluloflavus]|uniref:TetR/AcrR family transcriptional regulator C-terminal ligand-binding domain-containing protein n=1 Tax=Streptomyces celluloflavus TaxID=58344 RepID=UPI0036A59F5F
MTIPTHSGRGATVYVHSPGWRCAVRAQGFRDRKRRPSTGKCNSARREQAQQRGREHERLGATADQQAAMTVERGIARGELRPGNDPRWVLEALIVPSDTRTLLTGSPWTRTAPLDPDRLGPARRGDTGRQHVAKIR